MKKNTIYNKVNLLLLKATWIFCASFLTIVIINSNYHVLQAKGHLHLSKEERVKVSKQILEVLNTLGVSEEQLQKIKELQKKTQSKIQATTEKELSEKDLKKRMRFIHKANEQELRIILDEKQYSKFKSERKKIFKKLNKQKEKDKKAKKKANNY